MTVTATRTAGALGGEFIPYVYGATLGQPSRARPEKVLAHLKITTETGQKNRVPGNGGLDGHRIACGDAG